MRRHVSLARLVLGMTATLTALLSAPVVHAQSSFDAPLAAPSPTRDVAAKWMPDVASRLDKLRADAVRGSAAHARAQERWWSVACPAPQQPRP